MPWYSQYCHGWPRNKANPGNWIDESTNYVWNIAANSWNGGSYHPADTHACPPNQRSPTYQSGAPMSTAAPGGMIRLRYGGNGHTRGYNVGGPQNNNSPGTVSVYWKGAPEQEITDISEFTKANLLQTQGFADQSFSYPANPAIVTPEQGLVDKGNWFNLNLPKNMASGRHMMVWVWYYEGAPQWSTCFDVMIQGGASQVASAPAAAASVSSGKTGSSVVAGSAVGAVAAIVDTPAASPVVAAVAPAAAAPVAAAPAAASPAAASPAPAPATAAAPEQNEGALVVTMKNGRPNIGEYHGNPNSKVKNDAVWKKRHARDFSS